MTCPACRHPVRAGARFCEECGARIEQTCPACGAVVSPDKKFCGDCGARLPAAEPAAAPDARFASPSGYTPAHLAERILRERSSLEGERKQVTVLFADVSGFTSIAERLDPEDVHGLMNRAFEIMLGAIHRYEGTVNQFLGDGLMALFGAPVAHEDHARRAALAALAVQAGLARFREELQRERGLDFRMRMGLNTGLVVVGAIGDNLRMDYTAVGDTTNVAARMQQMAEPGQIVVADPTRRQIEDHFSLRALGAVTLKNRAEPVAAWELGSPRRGREMRALSPLVGRDQAMAALRRAWAGAARGRGQVVFLVGEPGIGKSRLLLELRREVESEAGWLEGRCVSFGQATAFLPLAETLRQEFAITDTDSEAAVIDQVNAALAGHGERGAALAPYLRFLLSVDPGDAAVVGMDPLQRRARIFDALDHLLRLSSQLRPVVMVVEDLHWVDSASEEFLKRLVDSVAGSALLLVLTWRPSYRPAFAEHTWISRILLEPLDEDESLRLVRTALGIADLPGSLAADIARKAEGNPFFLEEIGRTLVESGAVRSEEGRLVLTRAASTIVVPDRVQDVIAARIDRLTHDQKRTVQVASVIGREFTLRVLRRVAEAAERLEQTLAELKSLEFVYERVGPGDLEYVFKHALTQDVAYESILQARRREIDARIGDAIEDLYAGRLEAHVEELAHHFFRGEVWDRAARYAREAGDRAAALCVDPKAAEFYERALEALGHLPETADTARVGIDIRLAMRVPLWRGGQLDRLHEVYKAAEALALRHGMTDGLEAVHAFFAQYHWAKGQQSEAIAYGQRCLEAAERRQDLGLQVTAHYYLAWSYYVLGHFPAVVEHADRILALLEGPRAVERFGLSGLPYTGACAHAAMALLEQGDTSRTLAYLERGQRVADAAQHLYSTVPLGLARGLAWLDLGRVDEALQLLERMVALCRERRFVGQHMLALAAVSRAYSRAGRYEDAIAAGREAVQMKDEARAPVTRASHVLAIAEGCLGAGRLDEAEAAAREAHDWAERLGERPWVAWAEWTLGEIAGRRGQVEARRGHVAAARAIAIELGMRPLVTRCDEALATAS
jgi:class 3 adenylate cyclase/tetratricopeptide (TPR) repeat protein